MSSGRSDTRASVPRRGGSSGRRLEARVLPFDHVLHAETDELPEARVGDHVEPIVADGLQGHLRDGFGGNAGCDLLSRQLPHHRLLRARARVRATAWYGLV